MSDSPAGASGRELVALKLLASAAGAVHGPSEAAEKVQWVVEAARDLTAASVSVFVGVGSAAGLTVAEGVAVSDAERFARPAIRSWLDDGGPVAGIRRHESLASDPRYRTFTQRAGLGRNAAGLLVPVLAADELAHGALLLADEHADRFDADREAAVVAVAAHLGIALDNAATVTRLTELQAAQREIVHQLQEAVRPPVPLVESAELGVHYLPADPGAPTGGDLYDWLVMPDGDIHLAVVDVMGKGVAATKAALTVTHAVRLLALDGCTMDRLVARAATLVSSQSPDLVATVLVARYRPVDGVVQLAGGGHPPALLVPAEGEVRLVSAPGVPIGWPGAGTTEVVSVTLGRRDALVLYTDGLIEATKDVVAGLESLTAAAAQTSPYPAHHLARALVERALSGAQRRDDSLALVLRRRTPPPPGAVAPLAPFEYRFSPTPATIPLSRHLLADWLEHLAIDDGERRDLLLVASELCSNAVRHASGVPGGLSLRAWAEGDAVVVEVQDDGAGFEPAVFYDDDVPDPEAEQGRGLYVVEALADEVSVSRTDDHTVVRAVRRAVLPDGR